MQNLVNYKKEAVRMTRPEGADAEQERLQESEQIIEK